MFILLVGLGGTGMCFPHGEENACGGHHKSSGDWQLIRKEDSRRYFFSDLSVD